MGKRNHSQPKATEEDPAEGTPPADSESESGSEGDVVEADAPAADASATGQSEPERAEEERSSSDAEAPAGTEEDPAEGTPPAEPAKPRTRFRVWPHGPLSYNGEIYPPGYELAIGEAEFDSMASSAIERF